ncbi:MAG: alpha/beta hydrolase [Trichodesmium sp. ALOHA_ZT_67]|nr:alpha/beta hydrolase [Trichodesmium sp. ALOHA_ZT_67]MCL2929814.1 alpha/beta hydrolase [Trichodesmium sp. MAG_R01]MDE5092878.1 alpha/beta hydrolase [Trichodesmium sp. St11_bin5]
MQLQNLLSRSPLIILGALAGVMLSHQRAIATSKIVIDIAGPIKASIKVKDLRLFAETGETTKTISQALAISKVNPNTVRGLMTLEVGAGVTNLAKVLYSNLGQNVTKGVAEVLQTKHNYESDKALRSAIILAAADDNRISVLEILEKYPTEEMHIDVGKINEIVEKLKDTIGNLGKLLN